jgi:FlaA1/EpsC-like NDP-sugar epimerase
MSRFLTRGLQVVLDLVVLSLAYAAGWFFRFELAIPSYWWEVALVTSPLVVALEYGTLYLFGVPRFSWRYVSIRETERIAIALMAAAMVFVTMRIGFDHLRDPFQHFVIPFGVIASNLCATFIGLVGIRASRRLYGEALDRRRRATGQERVRVLLIGAGRAGIVVAREIAARPDLGLYVVGFIDDDMMKVGTQIGGVPVLGTTHQLVDIAQRKRVERALITIASAAGGEIRRITVACQEAKLDTKIIPGVHEIVGEQVNLSRIREVAIEDLLGREPVHLDEEQIAGSIRNAVVMVTGAGGSIGSELCRQVCRFEPSRLLLVERFENALFEIHRQLRRAYPNLAIEPHIADVTDAKRMDRLFAERTPKIVFHAAAHKHVPMMESNPGEAIKNNVGGTRLVADLSDRHGVERFVLVSTDKAVNPSSVMGATKRIAEIYTQSLGQRSRTRFVTVRFGNVLGSNGSVIPIFKEQIARGGPVTVTHPEMKRYFMTISEASQLVLQAGAMGHGGEIFILDMGEPVKIVDLARDLITLSGLRHGEDVLIEFTGMRPGEKLFEELATDGERADKTKHPKIFIGRIPTYEWKDVARHVEGLVGLMDVGDQETIRPAIMQLVPEFTGADSEHARVPKTQRRSDTTGPRDAVVAP